MIMLWITARILKKDPVAGRYLSAQRRYNNDQSFPLLNEDRFCGAHIKRSIVIRLVSTAAKV